MTQHINIKQREDVVSIDTLVEDIESIFTSISSGKKVDIPEDKLDKLLEGIKEVMIHWATPYEGSNNLRMSNVGKPNRQLWFDVKTNTKQEQMPPSVIFKFLFGHVVEELLLFFADLSGHKVTDQQQEVTVDGVTGHIDAIIDDVVIDVKTASDYAFKKFKQGDLPFDDPFGYLAQLSGYSSALKKNGGGFLVANKSTGELCLYKPDDIDLPNINKRISKVKKELKDDEPPVQRCHPIEPKGKSGNEGLNRKCIWCNHKLTCNPDVRVFKYASGLEYLTKVVKQPNVKEVTEDEFKKIETDS